MKTLLSRNNLVFNPPMLGGVLFLSGLPGSSGKIYDRSPYGNIGTITGATWKRLPSGLWCLSFDGSDDYVAVADDDSIRNLSLITIEFWLYPKSFGEGDYGRILSKNGVLEVFMHAGTSAVAGNRNCATTNARSYISSVTLNQWQQIVMAYDDATKDITMYLNGTDDTSWPTTGVDALSDDLGTLYIGSNSVGTNTFDGYIALLRIHNRALSAFEIRDHFEQEKHLFGVW